MDRALILYRLEFRYVIESVKFHLRRMTNSSMLVFKNREATRSDSQSTPIQHLTVILPLLCHETLVSDALLTTYQTVGRSVSQSVSQSVGRSVSQSVGQSASQSVSQSVGRSVGGQSVACLCVCLSVYVCVCVCLSISQSVCLSVCPSVSLSVGLSIHLSASYLLSTRNLVIHSFIYPSSLFSSPAC